MRISRLTGFLLGSVLAGAGVYYYILEEYKISNELLTEDIYVSFGCFVSLLLIIWGGFNGERDVGGRWLQGERNKNKDEDKANHAILQSLQNSVQRVHTYVQSLEEKLADLEKKKK